jgi:hypothetical protein
VKMTTTKRTETATTVPSLASSRICPVHFHDGSPRALFALSLLSFVFSRTALAIAIAPLAGVF